MTEQGSAVSSLQQHRNKKKYKRVLEEIDAILKVLTLTQEGLKYFKHFVSVQEINAILQTNKSILETQRKKYEMEGLT